MNNEVTVVTQLGEHAVPALMASFVEDMDRAAIEDQRAGRMDRFHLRYAILKRLLERHGRVPRTARHRLAEVGA
ncbi:MAG: hypothetical protein ACKVVT_00125 [Dehalococcoidia bacterium]